MLIQKKLSKFDIQLVPEHYEKGIGRYCGIPPYGLSPEMFLEAVNLFFMSVILDGC
jgi:hypothetical protein